MTILVMIEQSARAADPLFPRISKHGAKEVTAGKKVLPVPQSHLSQLRGDLLIMHAGHDHDGLTRIRVSQNPWIPDRPVLE
jgi:hypothetical protein